VPGKGESSGGKMHTRSYVTILFLSLLLAGSACGSSHYTPLAQQPTRTPELEEIRSSSAQPVSGEAGQLTAEWVLGTPPFRVVWTFSGGVEESIVWDTVNTRKYALPVIWSNPGGNPQTQFNCRVEISDVGNAYASRNFSFTVLPQAAPGG